ncbi:hypothetical protein ASE36_21965 [Rhizobium sp. Root274]|uniref:hypothetical protein n=1 Tax=unclassified Rhizobium TaxID=2613769 RepID=UPI000712CEBC|nr:MULTISPECIES: hypothetical protein [unclassified Rhizobium]KQW30122.1 hypothetical protein ASC71_22030 [Rhizobium sp. Root1240]KRD31245.1 hypothetical protein ASE36_21965 [Rhizobium sp. Root274]
MQLTTEQMDAVRSYRHTVRLAGCWGGCYEAACFIQHRFGWQRVDGVYALPDGRPIFLHSWNLMPDGSICDGTADQLGEGEDVACLPVDCGQSKRYREKFTLAHNPSVTPWLHGLPYVGISDRQFWDDAEEAKALEPGWWLADKHDYLSWFTKGIRQYPMFSQMRDGYCARSYEVSGLG